MIRREYRSGSRWAFWRWTDVRFQGRLYLRRLHLVKTPLFSVMLHWFHGPDPEECLHDHPVALLSLVLRGNYVEEREDGYHQRSWFNLITPTARHRVMAISPGTLTLALAGPKVREWGYHTSEGFVHWRTFQDTREGY